MSLLELQRTMREHILADDDAASQPSPGMAVYRSAYRNRLLDALTTRYERTQKWVGEESFTAAACHHVILTPPSSWTLDHYGADFPVTLEALFAEDPEVAELAWLEWHMQQAFAAPDCAVLDAAALAELAAGDWDSAMFALVPGFAARELRTQIVALWQALGEHDEPSAPPALDEPAGLIVWRKGLAPHYRQVDLQELGALRAIADGRTFGSICDEMAETSGPEAAVARLGAMLGQWLSDGLLAAN
jgi:Putative DNA-binding domain